MCEFLSGFVHDEAPTLKADKRYLLGDLRSHSRTMELHGIKYGHPDVWREFEWTEEHPDSLFVRGKDEAQSTRLRNFMLREFKSRSALLSVAKFPAGLTTLDLRSATVPADLKFPAGLTTLDLRSATVPADLKFPAGLTTLYLGSATVPADLKFPAGLTTLYLSSATVPADLKFPAGCRVIR